MIFQGRDNPADDFYKPGYCSKKKNNTNLLIKSASFPKAWIVLNPWTDALTQLRTGARDAFSIRFKSRAPFLEKQILSKAQVLILRHKVMCTVIKNALPKDVTDREERKRYYHNYQAKPRKNQANEKDCESYNPHILQHVFQGVRQPTVD